MDLSNYTIPLDTPISALEAEEAFNGLNDDEKLYCHFLSRGSWEGAPICLLQTSPESVPLFMLLRQLFTRQSVASLRTAVGTNLSDDEFQVCIGLGAASGWGHTLCVIYYHAGISLIHLCCVFQYGKLQKFW